MALLFTFATGFFNVDISVKKDDRGLAKYLYFLGSRLVIRE